MDGRTKGWMGGWMDGWKVYVNHVKQPLGKISALEKHGRNED